MNDDLGLREGFSMEEKPVSLENNKKIARRLTELLDQGNEAQLMAILSADFVSHFAGLPQPLDRQHYIQANQAAREAFGDLRRTVEDLVAEGDRVALRITARGTHTGMFRGILATGKYTEISGIVIRRIAGEQIIEEWVVNDQLGLLQQLGLIPNAS
jgi:steroid delta-isomerase-like uncharacterized protein